jgi:hypothetical protein
MESSGQVNATHYRAEARRIRREAATVKDEAIRSQLLEIVATYEQLAESIEKQQVNAAYYRADARRIRRAAVTVKDEAIGRQLLEIAKTYEKLAASIEKQR